LRGGAFEETRRRYDRIGSRKGPPMRAMTIAIPVSILLNIAAAAQDQGRQSPSRPTPPPGSAGTTTPQAPVGHRQPTERSLPPGIRKEEDAKRQPDPLGPVPKICSNC